MAFSNDQNEPSVPSSRFENRETSNLLPRYYRTKDNKKFLQGTLDQLTNPGTVKKLNGFIGRETAKATTSDDIFLSAADKTRQDYQLEPAAIIRDYLDNTTFFKDYIDHINHISVFDGNIENHQRINKQEFYSWNPHIDWDKFVNFQRYYWLPFGPDAIRIQGQQLEVVSEFSIRTVDEGDNVAYLFDPEGPAEGLVRNPTIRLLRGQTYVFDIQAQGHPFSIKTKRIEGNLDRYLVGVDNFAVESGKITFTVPNNSPDVLYYVSETDVDTGGVFHILDIEENTFLDVESDILGKKNYTVFNGEEPLFKLSNGMKLTFSGQITPEKYSKGYWYVEGVGTAIKLISDKDLEIRSTYVEESTLLFDDLPFDQLPYSETGTFPVRPDYITINRSSVDNNPWSRYNRWFHEDVIKISSKVNGRPSEVNLLNRATRPIIEFLPNIKLHNYGIISKPAVDLIDNFTKDVFSTIEGSLGYNIDGVDLVNGMRVLFNADTDPLVKNKIYKVEFINFQPPGRQITFNPEVDLRLDTSTIVFSTEHGLSSGSQITYLQNDNTSIPGLINRQIYFVKAVNTLTIALYLDRQLTKQVEIFGLSNGTHIFELFLGRNRQIHLVEDVDAVPQLYETVSIKFGIKDEIVSNKVFGNRGQNYWFNGKDWVLAQIKEGPNFPPLFDIFDSDGYSYSDITKYEGSNFSGNKIFSYRIGSGKSDSVLEFPLSYKNIDNVGDILFDFNLSKEKFSYKENLLVKTKSTDIGYLKISLSLENYKFENGWITSNIKNNQPIIRTYKDSGLTNNFPVDVFDNKNNLDDLDLRVYINSKRLNRDRYQIVDTTIYKVVVLNTDVSLTDIITLKCFSKQKKNQNGYYEIPINLQNNPLNENITEFTLGQVFDHVDSIIDNIKDFEGNYPGNSNLRDLGELTAYGIRFVQHSGPLNLALYHLGSKNSNLIKSLDQARDDYNRFKRSFIITATNSGIDTDPKRHVDFILQEMSKDKPKVRSYYLSDMFAYTAANRIEIVVLDSRIKIYPLSAPFSLEECSNKAINIYLNGNQLLHERDYIFNREEFFTITDSVELNENDLLEIYEYDSTDGCFCAPTPTKLGIYPAFEPKIYIDTSYLEPTKVIQGHDGSTIIAYDDYRDELILELEKRIFNNIKTKYNPDIFDIYNYIPGYSRLTDYSTSELNRILSKYFFQWNLSISQDYFKFNDSEYDRLNSFTWNYRGNYTPDGVAVPASWRGIYRWLFDTTTPHLKPWECLGFSIEPKWWESVYGPAPYTNDNLILWEDLRDGRIREPGKPTRLDSRFKRPILDYGTPVDDQGRLISPQDAGFTSGKLPINEGGYFEFGDESKVEAAWRKSSYYPFAVIQALILMHPAEVLGRCFDRSRIVKNLNGQLVYRETNLRIKLEDILIPSTSNSKGNRIFACGLINYIVDYLTNERTDRIDQYAQDLKNLTNRISTRLGGFTSKDKYRLLLDSKTPKSSGGVFVPNENYFIDLNVSSAIKKVVYSGVIITKFADGFEISGYNFENPYFYYFNSRAEGRVIRVGGISESFVKWESNRRYLAGKIVLAGNQYYRALVNHTSGEEFDPSLYVRLPELPLIGGSEAILGKFWDTSETNILSYGTKLSSIQDVVYFLQGYGEWLKEQGFEFDEFNPNVASVANWETSIKEFMFWTTQGWDVGSVLSLSPGADRLVFNSLNSVVDSIVDDFYGYSVYRVDGQKLEPQNIQIYRGGNKFIIEPDNTNYGIFGVTLYLVQKEHIAVLDDTTLFNDTIYDKPAGYRQEKIKALGYVTTNWNGGFEIPGFIYDQAVVNAWIPWNDYNLGDIVKYKEFYYSAKKFIPGTENFNDSDWAILEERPKNQLIPNWDYRAEQFTDFYDLDSDNFDTNQQKIAQHLTGYQKRQYLENIINNDVSQYKFYQGMIAEKGTLNVLSKLFDVLSADNKESLTFDEEWAFRVGEYGALDTFKEVEFILDESQFKIEPQPLEIVDFIDTSLLDFVYRQTPSNVYIKSFDFTKDIWKKTKPNDFLRTPGFVRKEDVKLNVDSISDLVGKDIEGFLEGDYVWAAFEGISWGVYRFTKSSFKILNATYSSNQLTIECDKSVDFSPGDVIGIETPVNEFDLSQQENKNTKLQGFYVVKNTQLNKIFVDANIQGFDNFDTNSPALLYSMTLQRVDNIDNANQILQYPIKSDEIIWVDDNGSGDWSVYQHKNVYSKGTILDNVPTTDLRFGLGLTIDDTGNKAAIANEDELTIYLKSTTDNAWRAFQIIELDSEFVVIKFSSDSKFLVVANYDLREVKIYQKNENLINLQNPQTDLNSYFLLDTITKSTVNLFGRNLAIAKNDDSYMLAISAEDKVYVFEYQNVWTEIDELTGTDDFGHDIALSNNFVLAVSSIDSGTGKVELFSFDGTNFQLFDTLSPTFSNDTIVKFGQSISLSRDGNYFAAGTSFKDVGQKIDVGVVYVYKFNGTLYEALQTVFSRNNEINEQFGSIVEFINNGSSLVIYSLNSDVEKITGFDNNNTIFDNNSLKFKDKVFDVGRVDVYERYNTKFIYGETLEVETEPSNHYGRQIAVSNNTILVSSELKDINGIEDAGIVYSYVRSPGSRSWLPKYSRSYKVDVSTIKKAFLYNRKTNELVTYLDVIDPTQNKIPGIADQEIKFKTYYDPAIYSKGNDSLVVDGGMSWTDKQVGMLWWDLTRAKFIDTEFGDVVYKTNAWNSLYDTASIDIYEWVESSVLPEIWDERAESDEGPTNGFTGKTKYGKDVYSVKRRYDNVSQQFINTYYFWVGNKITVPNIEGRKISARDLSNLISNPKGSNYPCLAFTDSNSVTLVNLKKYMVSSDIVLSIQYWTNDNRTSNYHSQWKLLSTNRNTNIPGILEEKWFHSLVGKDDQGRTVPDITLPLKQRYGIEYRPRQGMFVNRIEALKIYVERVNSILSTVLIADTYDISPLKSFEHEPSEISGLWDQKIDTDAELRFVQTFQIKTAEVSLIIIDGKITGGIVTDSGRGYGKFRVYEIDEVTDTPISWYGPSLKIYGKGTGAVLKTIVNQRGEVIKLLVEDSGEGYDDDTYIIIRPFSVLVSSDSSTNAWAIYSFDFVFNEWRRSKVQSYNVNDYWRYIDWYAPGFSEFVKIDYLFENTYELVTTEIEIGSIVKIKNIGSGGWVLLEKFNDIRTIDYTENYRIVGREKGTIQFLDSLYKPTKGYDIFLLDSEGYDSYPTEELRIILRTVKDNLLRDELKVEYLKLFFSAVRHALYEQTFVDWAMKTSFVKAMHNTGDLSQKVTYNSDNLEFFEEYIKEVKPYRTKIREYVSNYSKIDPTRTAITDFDLLPVINEFYKVNPLTVTLNEDAEIITEYSEINEDPWKFWKDNLGFEITSIKIVDQGEGYAFRPVVRINGIQLPGGTPARAKAYITKGKVNRIELVNPGSKWIKAPIITIDGSLVEGGRPARAVAIIGNSPIRTNYIKMKFDRISKVYQVTNLEETEIFTGATEIVVSGSRTQFPLRWSPDISLDKYSVEIDDVDILKNEYKIEYAKTELEDGSIRHFGLLTFNTAPPAGSTVQVRYLKNFEHLSATDRINFYYNPSTGQTGKVLSQLMTGIDYGGVTITGLDFENAFGWDSVPWFSEPWDSIPEGFEDYTVTVIDNDPNTYRYRLPYTPEEGQIINVYVSRYDSVNQTYLAPIRIDDIDYPANPDLPPNIIMLSFVGDGEIDIVSLPPQANLEINDKVIFRKIESDGSVPPREENYDTRLSGGDWSYITATGFAPDDIVLDGDGFVTPMTSHAPEEIVPGQIMDSLAIKVYSRPVGGSPNILFKTYFGDDETTDFIIGQYFQSSKSLIVKVNDEIKQLDIDYTVDYQNNLVKFLQSPPINSAVSILSINFTAANLLDLDYFIADGETTEYITKAPWFSTVNSTVLVNGELLPYELFSTDSEYTDSENQSWRSRVGIKFLIIPPAGSIINYIIDRADVEQTASIVKSETIPYTLSQNTYSLVNPVGTDFPFEPNVLVKTDNTILRSPSYEYFTLEKINGNKKLNYDLKDSKYQHMTLTSSDFQVYLDGKLLTLSQNYTVEFNSSDPIYMFNELSVSAAGTGYSVDDVLDVVGGDIGLYGRPARILVTEIIPPSGPTGNIRSIEVLDAGAYLVPPTAPITATGGSGNDVVITGNFIIREDLTRYSIRLRPRTFKEGKQLVVGIAKDADYTISSSNSITFTNPLFNVSLVEVISFYNHNVLKINRTTDTFDQTPRLDQNSPEFYEFSGKQGGAFKLNSTVSSGNLVWVIKNGNLLVNQLDYYLEDDYQTVRLEVYPALTDVIQIIAFTNTVVSDNFAFMQFKDIMNRVHYKRLNKNKTTKLSQPLLQFDKDIILEDASVLDEPNISNNLPGIIEINGERIEYFVKNGNILSQLRRGTLGTGIPNQHPPGELVQAIGISETIPYKDEFVKEIILSDGVSNSFTLPFTISKDEIEVFVGGYRLKKNSYILYSHPEYPYSPIVPISNDDQVDPVGTVKQGDEKLPPEFVVNGNVLELLTVPVVGTRILIVKKQGRIWNDIGKRLANSTNVIAKFVIAADSPWPN
jgi:hypothetical protein